MTPEARNRLIKTLGMLGSDHDGEVAAAGRVAHRLIREQGITWDEILVPAEPLIWDFRSAAREILSTGYVTEWENGFLNSLLRWRGPTITARQEQTLRKLYSRYCRRAA